MSPALLPFPPRIRVRIGVSGHRLPPKLPAEAEQPIRAVLDRIFKIVVGTAHAMEKDYAGCAPKGSATGASAAAISQFAIVSSIAEGADRIVAEGGLASGFTLEAVLPFARAEYERDFETEESRAYYQKLLARAAAVFELDGAAGERARAYEAAGFVMLANIDLLIAIWDGQDAAGVGGTAQMVSRAVADGIPVIWIDPASPGEMRISTPSIVDVPPANAYARPQESFRPADDTALALAVRDIISLPTQPEVRNALQRYLGEKERRWNFCPWYPLLLRMFIGRRLRRADFSLGPSLLQSEKQWQNYLAILPDDRAQRPVIEAILLPAFSAADHNAVYYSHIYRSIYVFNFLFAAITVAFALGGIFTHNPSIKSYLVSAELLIIIGILVTWLRGHHTQRHRRWLEYRRLAESLRHMRILAPIGSEGSVERPSRNLGGDEPDWVNWYAWSVRRLLPLPDRAIDVGYLEKIRDAVRSAEIADQISYHTANAANMAKLDHRIHRTGHFFFTVTGGICALFLCLYWFGILREVAEPYRDYLLGAFTFLTALLPTLGAALGAIQVQGDFKTLAEQSERTAKRLAAIDKVLAEEPPIFARLTDRIEKTSDILMSDLLEWQTVFRTRPLSLPA